MIQLDALDPGGPARHAFFTRRGGVSEGQFASLNCGFGSRDEHDKVARNREVLGIHYPSDSAAGKLLAEQSFKLLLKCKTVTQLIAEAKLEWPQVPQAAAAPSRSKVKTV